MSPSSGRCECFPGDNAAGADVNHYGSDGDMSCKHCRNIDYSSSYSCNSVSNGYLSLPLPSKDLDKLRRIVTASAKGFVIGAGIKGGLALFSILARLKRRKALASLRWNWHFKNLLSEI